MNNDFVPLSPKRTEPESAHGFRVKVVPAPGATPAFTPLAPPSSSAAPSAPGHAHGHAEGAPAAEPVLTVRRDGNRVTGIRIQCGCGQVIDLTCLY